MCWVFTLASTAGVSPGHQSEILSDYWSSLGGLTNETLIFMLINIDILEQYITKHTLEWTFLPRTISNVFFCFITGFIFNFTLKDGVG